MKNKKNKSKSNWFSYVVVAVVLLIPFMYSFFYLKAYWDPYGHMDDIPVAIVNEDKTVDGQNKGKDLVNSLKKKNTLDISVVNKNKADSGLKNKDYYAVITIPSDFTSDLLSAEKDDKTAATITYSPNQKSNYLASQIINRVVSEVEKQVRSNVSKEVVSTLTDNLNGVPKKVEKIDDGLKQISDGTSELKTGAYKLQDGTSTLSSKYALFNNGVSNVGNGTLTLSQNISLLDSGLGNLQSGVNDFASKTTKLDDLKTGVTKLKTGEDSFDSGLNTYVKMTLFIMGHPEYADYTISNVKPAFCTETSSLYDASICYSLNSIEDDSVKVSAVITQMGSKLTSSSATIKAGVDELDTKTDELNSIKAGVNTLKTSVDTLKNGSSKLASGSKQLVSGTNTLSSSSNEVLNGINTLNSGASTLASGTSTLNDGVNTAKSEVSNSISSTNSELKKLNGLDEYTANPVKVEEKDVNEVSEYGTAFSPFFMSIALWVGSLMLFIILYYDANDRFKNCSRNAENKVKRTFCYLGLATLQGIILGILLLVGLKFSVTNYFLYFASLILVAWMFEAIMEFLIVHFGDIGKFLALILLVLQLAAAGGTFPIQTVYTGFQKLFNVLPMKYSIDLFKEALISIEGGLLSKALIVIIIIFVVLFVINILKDIRLQKKASK